MTSCDFDALIAQLDWISNANNILRNRLRADRNRFLLGKVGDAELEGLIDEMITIGRTNFDANDILYDERDAREKPKRLTVVSPISTSGSPGTWKGIDFNDPQVMSEVVKIFVKHLGKSEAKRRLREGREHFQVVDESFKIDRRRTHKFPDSPKMPSLTCLLGLMKPEWIPLPAAEREGFVEIWRDESGEVYHRNLYHQGNLIEVTSVKKYKRGSLSIWFDRELSGNIRVPWSQIDAGKSWSSTIFIWDLYFKRREERRFEENIAHENSKRLESLSPQQSG